LLQTTNLETKNLRQGPILERLDSKRKLFIFSQTNRNPSLPHPLFRLLDRVFTIVKNARSQHGISPANAHAIGQVVKVAHAA
jgi:hypothetical protein